MRSRRDRIRHLQENPNPSVLIVGAGINGIGTFWDLALQGIDVVMVDRGDYCSGASAASSHMVHGGIRYLENGEFRLVREAVSERNRLLENAPHLVKPMPTTFPIFRMFSGLFNAPLKFFGILDRPAERGAIVIKIGMLLYDYYTRKQKTVPIHKFRGRQASLRKFPDLNPEIIYTGTYYDGAMPSPERIAVELITDAEEANGQAIPLNYVTLESAKGDCVILRDLLDGDEITLQPRIVVNAGGPWIDQVNNKLSADTRYIGGTKGSHVILNHPQLRAAIGENEFFFENKDGRIVLIYPIADKVLVGTSDLKIDNPDEVVITDEEINYFFDMIGRVFPKISVNHSQIVYTFSGVRPLPYSDVGFTGQISRDHKIELLNRDREHTYPVLSLVGGKWTTFRAFAEKTTDQVLASLGQSRRRSTVGVKIGGSHDYPATDAEKRKVLEGLLPKYPIKRDRLETLFSQYGTKIVDLLEMVGEKASIIVDQLPSISIGEVEYLLQTEDVVHLDDLIFRRTMLGKLGQITPGRLQSLSVICADILGWSDETRIKEVERVNDILRTKHKMVNNQFIGD